MKQTVNTTDKEVLHTQKFILSLFNEDENFKYYDLDLYENEDFSNPIEYAQLKVNKDNDSTAFELRDMLNERQKLLDENNDNIATIKEMAERDFTLRNEFRALENKHAKLLDSNRELLTALVKFTDGVDSCVEIAPDEMHEKIYRSIQSSPAYTQAKTAINNAKNIQ